MRFAGCHGLRILCSLVVGNAGRICRRLVRGSIEWIEIPRVIFKYHPQSPVDTRLIQTGLRENRSGLLKIRSHRQGA
jgi:hypothetical protein